MAGLSRSRKRLRVAARTFCEGKVKGTFAQKRGTCMVCDWYKIVKGQV